jgi:hypothetical protein
MAVLLLLAHLISAASAPGAEHAALLYLRGDVGEARDEVTAALAKDLADPHVLFVRACLELESTGPAGAEPFVRRLELLSPPPPQASVLRALLTRRASVPKEPIYEALGEAWKAVGRPDLSSAALLPESWPEDLVPPPSPDESSLSPQDRLVFGN